MHDNSYQCWEEPWQKEEWGHEDNPWRPIGALTRVNEEKQMQIMRKRTEDILKKKTMTTPTKNRFNMFEEAVKEDKIQVDIKELIKPKTFQKKQKKISFEEPIDKTKKAIMVRDEKEIDDIIIAFQRACEDKQNSIMIHQVVENPR